MIAFTDIGQIDCTPEEYFKIKAVSNSDLGLLAESPRKYKDSQEGTYVREETAPMAFGSAFDSMLLTPDDYARDYAVIPESITTPTTSLQIAYVRLLSEGVSEKGAARLAGYKKAPAKGSFQDLIDFEAESEKKLFISKYDEWTMSQMKARVLNHKLMKVILKEAEKQVVFTAKHEATGLKCKCMIDLLWEPGHLETVDLKTTSAKDAKEFRRSHFFKYGYDRQAAFYGSIAGAFTSSLMPVSRVSNWHQMAPLEEYLEEGCEKASRLLEAMAWHWKNDEWDYSHDYYTGEGWEVL